MAIATAVLLAGLAIALIRPAIAPLPIACALSAAALLALHQLRHRIHPTTLRAAADLALLTPVLLLPFLERLSS